MKQEFGQGSAAQPFDRTPWAAEVAAFTDAACHHQWLIGTVQYNLPNMNTWPVNTRQAKRPGLVEPGTASALIQAPHGDWARMAPQVLGQ
jgi:hypothetical protein